MKTRIIFQALMLSGFMLSLCGAAERYPRVHGYGIEAEFYPEQARMEARASVAFDSECYPLDEVTFYLHGELRVDSILIGGKSTEFKQDVVFYQYNYALVALKCDFNMENVTPGDKIDIYYSGYFHPSQASSPSDYMRIDETGVYLRAYGYSLWFPLFLEAGKDDYQIDFEPVILKTPVGFHAVFVGDRLGDETVGNWQVSEWSAPNLSLFYAQCTASRFEIYKQDNLMIYHWRDSASTAMAIEIADFAGQLEQEYRERYNSKISGGQMHIVEMPKYGDIASGNMIGIADEVWLNFVNETWPKTTLAHELVHRFVKVDIPRSNPLYALAIEGFPTYFDDPVLGDILGGDWYEKHMEETEKRYLKYKTTGVSRRGRKLPVEKPLDQIAPDEIGDYKDLFILSDRAPLFLNYLRSKAGEDNFNRFCKALFESRKMDNESFRKMAAEFTGVSRSDIDLWLSTNDYPERFHLQNLKQ